jgi:hypothetical protein
MRRWTVGEKRPCAACAIKTEVPDPGEAYLSGVVLGAVNGEPFLRYELETLCEKHKKALEEHIKALDVAEREYFRGQS